jgi:hypothetical protein
MLLGARPRVLRILDIDAVRGMNWKHDISCFLIKTSLIYQTSDVDPDTVRVALYGAQSVGTPGGNGAPAGIPVTA